MMLLLMLLLLLLPFRCSAAHRSNMKANLHGPKAA